MIRDTATCIENHQRFLRRVVASEVVWGLRGLDGFATAESDEEGRDVLVFWSDEAYARRAQQMSFEEYMPEPISLFDFLYRWLPGMADDEVMAGTNWTGDLIGLEIEPMDLQEQLKQSMGTKMVSAYRRHFNDLQRKSKKR